MLLGFDRGRVEREKCSFATLPPYLRQYITTAAAATTAATTAEAFGLATNNHSAERLAEQL